MLYGAIIEGVATLLCRLTTRYLGDLEPKYATAIDSFVATALVVAAFDYSGGSDGLRYTGNGAGILGLFWEVSGFFS